MAKVGQMQNSVSRADIFLTLDDVTLADGELKPGEVAFEIKFQNYTRTDLYSGAIPEWRWFRQAARQSQLTGLREIERTESETRKSVTLCCVEPATLEPLSRLLWAIQAIATKENRSP